MHSREFPAIQTTNCKTTQVSKVTGAWLNTHLFMFADSLSLDALEHSLKSFNEVQQGYGENLENGYIHSSFQCKCLGLRRRI